jgi:hypothetical protein
MDSTPTTTTFSNRCDILAELWMNYRDNEDFKDFVEYNDLGLPLAYAISKEIVISTANSEMLIDETWEVFLAALDTEDTGFESLDEVLGIESDDASNDD